MIESSEDYRQQLHTSIQANAQALWDNPTERSVFYFAEGVRELETKLFGEGYSVHSITIYPLGDGQIAIDLNLDDIYGGPDESGTTANL